MQHSQQCALNLTEAKKELISKENVIKHPFVSNLIRVTSVYFLRDANAHMIFLSLQRLAKMKEKQTNKEIIKGR